MWFRLVGGGGGIKQLYCFQFNSRICFSLHWSADKLKNIRSIFMLYTFGQMVQRCDYTKDWDRLKSLTNARDHLYSKDPVSGNSPLILLAAEGLCGPVRNLINHVPVDHLLLVNRSSNSVLSLLLARGHGCCGCLEILLRRLSSSSLLHPTQPCNRIILKTADLLEQIKTSSIDRVVGVVNLWISVNFIDLEDVVTGKLSGWWNIRFR